LHVEHLPLEQPAQLDDEPRERVPCAANTDILRSSFVLAHLGQTILVELPRTRISHSRPHFLHTYSKIGISV